MKVTTEQIKHVATLARLKLTDDEVKSLNMEAVIEFADKLSELDAAQVVPTNHTSDITLRYKAICILCIYQYQKPVLELFYQGLYL